MLDGSPLTWALALLGIGAMGGLGLVMLSQVAPQVLRRGWPGAVHGLFGVAGFGLLLAGLGGPARGVASGTASFGVVAAVFVGLALAGGAVLVAAQLRGRAPSLLVVGLHATAGVAGLVMLTAYLS